MPTKSTQMEMQKRIDEITEIRILGAEFRDVKAHAEEQGWNLSERQLRNYVSRSDAEISASVEKDKEKILARGIAQRHAIYARCMASGDFRTALAAVKNVSEVYGLYPPKKSELSGPGGGPIQTESVVMTDADLNTALLAVLQTMGTAGANPNPEQAANGDGQALGGSQLGDDQGWDEP